MKKYSTSVLFVVVILFLLIFLAGCLPGLTPTPPKAAITGRIMIPNSETAKDISGWIPVANATVTLTDSEGVIHTVTTDEDGYYIFTNIAVNANTIITATAMIDGNIVVIKDVIPQAVTADEDYNGGTADAESTALALIVEDLIEQGLTYEEIDLEEIQSSDNFAAVLEQVSSVLEENGNVTTDPDVTEVVNNTAEEIITPPAPSPPTPVTPAAAVSVSAITVTGDAVVGATLTAAPTPENATGTYQWTICDTVDGIYTNIGTNSNTYVPVTGDAGKFIKAVFTASGNYTGSQTSVATASVANAAQDAPTGLAGVAPTSYVLSDGSITGTTTLMEYKLSTDVTYITVTGTSITGLVAGTYNVRYAAKTGYNAGTVADVVVAEADVADVATLAELQAALANTAITTINITADITATTALMPTHSVNIYGNNNTITSSASRIFNLNGSSNANLNEANAEVGFYDVNLVSTSSAASDRRGISLYDLNGTKVVIDNVSVIGNLEYALNVAGTSTVLDVMISYSEISGWAAINSYSSNSTFTITNSTLTGTNDKPYSAGGSNGFATIVFYDIKDDPQGKGQNNTITVTNSTVTATQTTGNQQHILNLTYLAGNNDVTFTGCNLSQPTGQDMFNTSGAGIGNTITVDGTITVTTAVTSVTVDPATATVVQGQTQQLTATVAVVGGAAQTVNWTSSDAKVTVSADGLVTVAADAVVGEYTVTATSAIDDTKSDTSLITVTAT